MSRYVHNRFSSQYKATIGADFITKEVNVGTNVVTLQIWDTAGQERFQSLGTAFYRGADGCIIVYGLDDYRSRQSVIKWRDEFLITANPTDPHQFPLVIVGNKLDMVNNTSKNTYIPYRTDPCLKQIFSESEATKYIETSAKTGDGIDEAFSTLIQLILEFRGISQNIDLELETIQIGEPEQITVSKCSSSSCS